MTERNASQYARLLCVGFHGTEVSNELAQLIRRGVRSTVLFSRNVADASQVATLSAAIKALTTDPIAIAVDQEGGPVRRLRDGFTELSAMRALGNSGDPELAFEIGALLGAELRAVGIDWNFAPVLDVDTNPANPVIGARAFGSDASCVAKLGVALARGLESVGVAACAKHFPGHGDTELDSHLALPKITHSLERLRQIELVPFAAASRANVPSMMSAHVVFSALDPDVPATLSPRVLAGLLRGELGYPGLVVSDDLEMKAIIDHFGIEDAVVRGVLAGVDVFLVCHTAERAHLAIDALERSAAGNEAFRHAAAAALARQRAFNARFAQPANHHPDLSCLASPRHRELARRLARFGPLASAADPTEQTRIKAPQ